MAKQDPPVAEQWYPLKLGQTCSDDATSRFYSLRYEFKPASIDTSRRGSLHSSSDNKVTVEFFNNQAGKPKVAFEGNVGDYQELDAMLFFDGQSFRLERMHRAVKSLRHIRMPGESSAAAASAAQKEAAATEPESPQDGNGSLVERISAMQPAEKSVKKPAGPAVRSEKIEVEAAPVVTKPDPPAGKKKGNKKTPAEPKGPKGKKASPPIPPTSPLDRKREREPSPVNIKIDDEVEEASPSKKAKVEEEVEEVVEEIEEESDYEEVDISEDEDVDKTGVDQTAATLRAQAAAGLSEAKASSSSSSSGSGSSESGSGSSSSDSGSDEEDTASSADDGDDI
ncbi:unnamed protein product [Calypogeia fissa]